MSQIRGKNTKPEILVRKFLFQKGFRFRLHVKKMPGTPDIVLPKYKTVIFVQGCFWHRHQECKDGHIPDSNQAFWLKKINENISRDENNFNLLRAQGWNVIVIWGCELKSKVKDWALGRLVTQLTE